jgi:hypothetical protein
MPKKKFSPEQIVTLLRQIEVACAQGKSVPVACREPPAPAPITQAPPKQSTSRSFFDDWGW